MSFFCELRVSYSKMCIFEFWLSRLTPMINVDVRLGSHLVASH